MLFRAVAGPRGNVEKSIQLLVTFCEETKKNHRETQTDTGGTCETAQTLTLCSLTI